MGLSNVITIGMNIFLRSGTGYSVPTLEDNLMTELKKNHMGLKNTGVSSEAAWVSEMPEGSGKRD